MAFGSRETPRQSTPDASVADGFVDLHSHLLPAIDDGPENLDQSVALCRVMWREGVREAVATPHQLGGYGIENDPARIRAGVSELQQRLDQLRIGLRLHAGGEVRLDERIARLVAEDRVATIGDNGRHVLIELPPELSIEPEFVIPRMTTSAGPLTVVLAHVERYGFMQKDAGAAERWADAGAILQINTGSLVGLYGEPERKCAWDLLTRGLVQVVASDAHNLLTRLPRWSDAVRLITTRLGAAAARAVCIDNPAAILRGRGTQ